MCAVMSTVYTPKYYCPTWMNDSACRDFQAFSVRLQYKIAIWTGDPLRRVVPDEKCTIDNPQVKHFCKEFCASLPRRISLQHFSEDAKLSLILDPGARNFLKLYLEEDEGSGGERAFSCQQRVE